jgi:acetoin utilization protein AcuB
VRQQIPLVKAVMTPFPYSVRVDASCDEARRMMGQHDIRHLPVIDGERLVGVVSDRDLRMVIDPTTGSIPEPGPKVGDICERSVFVVELTERLDRVLSEMLRRRIGSAIIMRGERTVGIFTMVDACRFLTKLLGEFFPTDGSHVA